MPDPAQTDVLHSASPLEMRLAGVTLHALQALAPNAFITVPHACRAGLRPAWQVRGGGTAEAPEVDLQGEGRHVRLRLTSGQSDPAASILRAAPG